MHQNIELFLAINLFFFFYFLFLFFQYGNGCCFCRMLTCPAAEMVDGSKLLYLEQVSFTKSYLLFSIVLHSFFKSAIFFKGGFSFFSYQAFWRTPQKPFRQVCYALYHFKCAICKILLFFDKSSDGCSLQRFYMVKPCPKELKCDVEVGLLILFMNSVNNVYILHHCDFFLVFGRQKIFFYMYEEALETFHGAPNHSCDDCSYHCK